MKCCVCQSLEDKFGKLKAEDAITIESGNAYCKKHRGWYRSAGEAAYIVH